jgi:hypothetical protein
MWQETKGENVSLKNVFVMFVDTVHGLFQFDCINAHIDVNYDKYSYTGLSMKTKRGFTTLTSEGKVEGEDQHLPEELAGGRQENQPGPGQVEAGQESFNFETKIGAGRDDKNFSERIVDGGDNVVDDQGSKAVRAFSADAEGRDQGRGRQLEAQHSLC